MVIGVKRLTQMGHGSVVRYTIMHSAEWSARWRELHNACAERGGWWRAHHGQDARSLNHIALVTLVWMIAWALGRVRRHREGCKMEDVHLERPWQPSAPRRRGRVMVLKPKQDGK